MTNFKQPIILWTLLSFTVACKKEAPEQYPVDGLYSHTLPTGGVVADSSTVVEMSVTLKEEDFANDRIVHFTTTSGRWLSPGASAESVALISAAIMEGARDGRSVAELMQYGTTLLSREDLMDGIAEMIPDIQDEGTFPDGTKLVTVHGPIA